MWPLFIFLVALAAPAVPLTTDQPLTAEQQQVARALEAELVAPCCWSQQVSVHQSPAADEVRQDIRRRLARGETRQQILDDYVVQFGERILVQPPAKGYKLLLYVFPPVALVVSAAGIVALVRRFTTRRAPGAPETGAAAASTPARDASYQERLEDELRDLD